MANTAQARKRARQAVKQRAHNASLRSTLRTAIKKIIKAVEAGDKAAATAAYSETKHKETLRIIKVGTNTNEKKQVKVNNRDQIKIHKK